MKILLDLKKCIGCGSCSTTCPDVFSMGDDIKVHIKDSISKELDLEEKELNETVDCIEEAANICPVQAILIEKKVDTIA